MDETMVNALPAKLVDEMIWRSHCVNLRQNAKHIRRQMRAIGAVPAPE
jgi:hypothetical protein